jgi:di/tricarboxylate transporter
VHERQVISARVGERRRVRGDGQLVAALPRNRMVFRGRTAGAVDFWGRYNARLIGIDAATVKNRRLSSERIQVGETLLLEVSKTALARLRKHPDLVLLGEFVDDFDRRRMWMTSAIVAGVVAGAALTPLPIVVTAIAGVIVMVATGCVVKEDIYSGVSWDVIFLLAGVIPLGIAMQKSGGADWLGEMLAAGAGGLHPVFVLMAIYLVTTLLTELVSNNAAAVILVPVASALALELGLEPLPLVLAVMFAASTSFLSPVGYQTNTMIFGTGVYRFTDFVKVGAPLNLLLMITTSLGLYAFWPVVSG